MLHKTHGRMLPPAGNYYPQGVAKREASRKRIPKSLFLLPLAAATAPLAGHVLQVPKTVHLELISPLATLLM